MGVIDYHLRELAIAKDKSDPRMVLPQLSESDQVILDIGCGIGQTMVALDCLDRQCIGVDVDPVAIGYGQEHYGAQIEFHCSDANELPVAAESVDLVISRVALPYTNIPKAIQEIRRVLKPGGRAWLTLHSQAMVRGWLLDDLKDRHFKSVLQRTYVLLNGVLFRGTGKVLPYLNGQYESWQNVHAFARWLGRQGFDVGVENQSKHDIVTAKRTE